VLPHNHSVGGSLARLAVCALGFTLTGLLPQTVWAWSLARPAIVRPSPAPALDAVAAVPGGVHAAPDDTAAATLDIVESRWRDDLAAMQAFRPGYSFWQHIFTIPDGSIVFGSAIDGRFVGTVPERGDWTRAVWADPGLAAALASVRLPANPQERRERLVLLLEPVAGPVLHNPTRGRFLLPNAERYGGFLRTWGTIYERFGVPEDLGLAQAILESGLNGTRRSEARAIGLCQWLDGNWKQLNRLAPTVIEVHNQTTQAAYCAAYLSVLATKYGSFIPALSEHHAGGTNVGRTLINGDRLGARDVRERYFLGSKLARDLRLLPVKDHRDVYQTYGPRSYLYAEMVFGNTLTVRNLLASIPQVAIHAMRAPRAIPLGEVTRRTRLSADEVRRYNPALVRQVPAGANLYLPAYVESFGPDVAFWQRPAPRSYAAILDDFLSLEHGAERWDDPAFEGLLRDFQRRFRETKTEEGAVMSTVLAYAIDDAYTSNRRALLAEFRNSERVAVAFLRGVQEVDTLRQVRTASIGVE
jgi:hypothetical protein